MVDFKDANYYLSNVGKKIKAYRVSEGITQEDLELKTGISSKTIARLEKGISIQLDSFFKILLELNLGNNIELLVPDQTKSPFYYLDLEKKGKKLLRARKNKGKNDTFKWGDE